MYFHARGAILFTCFFLDSRLSSLQMKSLNFPSSIEYGQVLADNDDNNGQENYFPSSLVVFLCLHV